MPVLPGWHLSPGVDELRDDGESCLTFELSRNMILVIQAESVGEKSGLAFVCTLKRTGDGGTWIIKYEIEAFGRSRRNGVGNAIFELPLEMAENETVAALSESPAGNLMGAVDFNRLLAPGSSERRTRCTATRSDPSLLLELVFALQIR